MASLTAVDIRILEAIQKDSSQSTSELAEKVGLSQSPCWRRLQRLKDEGYIEREVAILDRSKFEHSFIVFAALKMDTLTDEKRSDFLRKVEITPEIMECYSTIGETDILLKIVASSLEWYQKFVFKTLLRLPGVKDIQTTVTLAEMKCSTAIPVRSIED